MATYDYIESTGVIVPDTSQTKTTVSNEYRGLFGADLIIDDESPEGLIINAEVEQRDALAKNNANLANQINPNLAEGVFLDALFALLGGERDDGLPTTFSVAPTVTGVNGTVIPAQSRAESTSGDIFESVAEVTIPPSGTTTVQFQSVEDRAIQVEPGELNSILDQVLGWETVDNTVAATPGRVRQSDQAARLLRRETLAFQGRSTPQAVFANVRAVDDVASLSFRENIESTVEIIDGVTLPAHSVYVCVDGGLDLSVASSLLNSKTAGSQWHNGESANAVSVQVTEPVSGQNYTVIFDRPDDVPMECSFTISTAASVADPAQAVRDAVLAYANGEIEGERGFIVGGDVSPFELSGAVTSTTPAITVRQVTAAKFGEIQTTDTVPIELWEKASILAGNIAVNIV